MRALYEVEKSAQALGDNRWDKWTKCGVHYWQTLPQTDSGDHYCPNCCTIWTHAGAILNRPEHHRFNFSCAVQFPFGSSGDVRQTDIQHGERHGGEHLDASFFVDVVRPHAKDSFFSGVLHLSGSSLSNLTGETRTEKSVWVRNALVAWVKEHGLQPDFALEVMVDYVDGKSCRVSLAPR